jgi:hypothetical protein
MPLAPFYRRILQAVPDLPDIAVIPLPAAAVLMGMSERSLKDGSHPRVRISEKREGLTLGYIRNRNKETASLVKGSP